MEVPNIVQKTVTKTIVKKKKCKKAKWLSEETLQIGEEKRETKSKRERYTQLNAEFQRIARRDKKPFLNEKCKEIEGKKQNRRDQRALQEIRGVKATFHARMGMMKNKNDKVLREAEEIIKRWQENTEKLYKKVLITGCGQSSRVRHPGI